MAQTRADANKAFDLFVEIFGRKYPKAIECLQKDRDVLLTFYDFPAEHWSHLRTTNPIESPFRALNGSTLIGDLIAGIQFVDGIKKDAA